MAQSTAIRRLKKEYTNLQKDPTPGAHVRPLETNFLHAHFLLHAEVFHDTPYEGGVYHGVLKFPSNYPLKPPIVIMRTPSGRFQPDKKICFSMSDFHPELWNPMWSISSILTGLISFMNSKDITTGGVRETSANRIQLAKESLRYCSERDALASELFKDELESIAKEREGSGDAWPPERKVVKKEIPKIDEAAPARRSRRIRNTTRLNSRGAQNETNTTETDDNQDEEVKSPEPSTESNNNNTSSNPGKNSARNKKKKEKEKRKKLVKKFETNLTEQVPKFLEAVQARLLELGLDVNQYQADHVCWRTESLEEYSELASALSSSDNWTLLVESEIGGRSIATFQMKQGITVGERMMDVVEIPAPKDGSPYKAGLEHVEYVISTGENKPSSPRNDETHERILNDFMTQFPGIEWKTKAKNKELYPDVSTKVELPNFNGTYSVKFHLMPLAEVIRYEIDNNK